MRQTLFNILDSLDEIAAVLAHEVDHLRLKTSEKKYSADQQLISFGVGWLHEATADVLSKDLLEKAGFNTFAWNSAIRKISGSQRGSIYQTGIARATEGMARDLTSDFETSAQAEKPVPSILKGKVIPSNLDIMLDEKNKHNTALAAKAIGLLHPRDLLVYYENLLFDTTSNRPFTPQYQKSVEIVTLCQNLIVSRLTEKGYNPKEIALFLAASQDKHSTEGLHFFKKPEDLYDICTSLADYETSGKYSSMYNDAFGSVKEKSPTLLILKRLEREVIDVSAYPPSHRGIPVTQDSLLKTLQMIQSIKPIEKLDISEPITSVLLAYVDHSFRIPQGEKTIDKTRVKQFFQKVKDMGINISLKNANAYTWSRNNTYVDDKEFRLNNNNIKIIHEAFNDIFTPAEKVDLPDIDNLFIELKRNFSEDKLSEFTNKLRQYFDRNKIPDEERQIYLDRLAEQIDSFGMLPEYLYPTDYKSNSFSESPDSERIEYFLKYHQALDSTSSEIIQKMIALKMKILFGSTLFRSDGPQFYEFMNKSMLNCGINPKTLKYPDLLFTCGSLLKLDNPAHFFKLNVNYTQLYHYPKPIIIGNYLDFGNLPLIKELISRNTDISAANIRDLNDYAKSLEAYLFFSGNYIDNLDIKHTYGESLQSLVLFQGVRNAFEKIISNGIVESDYYDVYDFIGAHFPESVQKTQILRDINFAILHSPNTSLDRKIHHLKSHFDTVGVEGLIVVAEQIHYLHQYQEFRNVMIDHIKGYLDGSITVTAIASIDNITSNLTKDWQRVLRLCQSDTDSKKLVTTELAEVWVKTFLSELYRKERLSYDKRTGKFITDELGLLSFRSFADCITTLEELSRTKRFAIGMKSLTDKESALSSPQSRMELSKYLGSALNLQEGSFADDVLNSTCTITDPELIAVPGAQMIANLFGNALNIDSIDFEKLMNSEIFIMQQGQPIRKLLSDFYSPQEIHSILHARTKELLKYGIRYQVYPDTPFAQLVKESGRQLDLALESLHSHFQISTNRNETEKQRETSSIDSSTEALIKGVEASHALGTKSLQLSVQLKDFSPELESRLSDCFDANPGLNKLLFWENLLKQMDSDPQFKDFVERRMATLDEYLGGGSLYTTYAATLRTKDGGKKEVVIKLLNPNAEGFVKRAYDSSRAVLENVISNNLSKRKKQSSENIKNAQMGLLLLDLSHQWCLKEINDPAFVSDDDRFKRIITDFNSETGLDAVSAPEREFTSSKAKCEERAKGVTLKAFLKDTSVPQELKQKAIDMYRRFYEYQFQTPQINAQGVEEYLVLSDPHIGNVLIDSSTDHLRLGIIDRHMYMKLAPEDVAVRNLLKKQDNYGQLISGFIERVTDINKVRNAIQKGIISARTIPPTIQEYLRQSARGKIDPFSLFRTIMSTLVANGMYIPLELQLAFRNELAFKRLAQKYA